jgi:AraC-like DNA-binding protein
MAEKPCRTRFDSFRRLLYGFRHLALARSTPQPMRLQDLVTQFSPPPMQHVPLLIWHHLRTPTAPGSAYKHVDFHSVFLIERGSGIHVIDATPYSISRGDVYLSGAGSEHGFLDCQRLIVHAILFRPALFERSIWNELARLPGFDVLTIGQPANRRLHLTPTAYAETARDLAQLWSEWQGGTPSGAILTRTLLLSLLVRLARHAAGETPPTLRPRAPRPDRENIVATAVRTIDLRYGEALRVSELAATAHLSPDRFTEVFASVMGRTPRNYLRHVRLEAAQTLLGTTMLPVSHIARLTGFRSHPNFSRAFRSATNTSPQHFRQRLHTTHDPTGAPTSS